MVKPLKELSKTLKTEVSKYGEKEVATLVKALGACALVQRTYGKQGTDFEKQAKVFLRVLQNYEPEAVISAIKNWILKSKDFPTPADIVDVLENKPTMSADIYREACKIVNDQEGKMSDIYDRQKAKKYCQEYESQMIGFKLR